MATVAKHEFWEGLGSRYVACVTDIGNVGLLARKKKKICLVFQKLYSCEFVVWVEVSQKWYSTHQCSSLIAE